MTNYPLNIFDQFGNVSNNLSEAEIAKCSPAQQAVLFPLLTAWSETQEEDKRCNEVEANRRKAQTALDRTEKVLADVTPKWTAHQEWQKTVARMQMPEPDPAVIKKVKAAQKVRDAAEEYLGQITAEVLPARAMRDQKRRAFTDLLREWSKNDGRPKTTADLVKERSATERKIAMDNIANGLPADYSVAQTSSVGDSHLDRFKAGSGKGGSANYGYNQNRLRGAQLPKVPSER